MTRGFQIWPHNSNRITFEPPLWQKKTVENGLNQVFIFSYLIFDNFFPKRGSNVIGFQIWPQNSSRITFDPFLTKKLSNGLNWVFIKWFGISSVLFACRIRSADVQFSSVRFGAPGPSAFVQFIHFPSSFISAQFDVVFVSDANSVQNCFKVRSVQFAYLIGSAAVHFSSAQGRGALR